MPERIFDAESVGKNICWDVDLEREFKGTRPKGYTFVIDVCEGVPRLALYRMKPNYSTSTTLDKQPPRGLLEKAVGERGGLDAENIYPINNQVRAWIEQNLLVPERRV